MSNEDSNDEEQSNDFRDAESKPADVVQEPAPVPEGFRQDESDSPSPPKLPEGVATYEPPATPPLGTPDY